MAIHTVNKIQGNARFDLQVLVLRPELTRNAVQNLIRDGVIKLNSERTKPNFKIKVGDIIEFDEVKIQQYVSKNDKSELIATNLNLKILYEDQDIIAINKPIGMVSHPDSKHRSDSALNGIFYHLKQTNQNNTRVRMIHRLDKATSGVLLAAKHLAAHTYYSQQFADGRVKKEYVAVVQGNFRNYCSRFGNLKQVTIETYLKYQKDSQIGKSKSVVTENKDDDRAITEFFVQEVSNGYSMLVAKPKTGRTHQIRIHLAHVGYPIVGDGLYGGEKFERLMLHAHKLILKTIKQKRLVIEAPLPEVF